MIIQIRGTSGSGKSTIVKKILELYEPENIQPIYKEGRKRPLYYEVGDKLAIIGHYETKCGGCDTISIPGQSYPIIFDLIRKNAEEGRNVLFEGLLISGDLKWTKQLKDLGLCVIILDTSLEVCLESINNRRKLRLKEFTPVNPTNTETKYNLIKKGGLKLQQEGIQVSNLSREEALEEIRKLLNV